MKLDHLVLFLSINFLKNWVYLSVISLAITLCSKIHDTENRAGVVLITFVWWIYRDVRPGRHRSRGRRRRQQCRRWVFLLGFACIAVVVIAAMMILPFLLVQRCSTSAWPPMPPSSSMASFNIPWPNKKCNHEHECEASETKTSHFCHVQWECVCVCVSLFLKMDNIEDGGSLYRKECSIV